MSYHCFYDLRNDKIHHTAHESCTDREYFINTLFSFTPAHITCTLILYFVCATSERKHLRKTWRENCVVYISYTKISREHTARCLHNRETKAIKNEYVKNICFVNTYTYTYTSILILIRVYLFLHANTSIHVVTSC
jgi:hypothetical protein